ncbi:hypothetical protein SUSAZ_11090 [Sulfolobus acidocaldarius SUSAZ]|nr:hypothetical protein SUSAZ_11090 [Sulfolobus acidocaldarius SUSAZ]
MKVKSMNKLVGLLVSSLFLASILIGIAPAITTTALTPPVSAGGIQAYLLTGNGAPAPGLVLFVVNVSNVNVQSSNVTNVISTVVSNIQINAKTVNAQTQQTTGSVTVRFPTSGYSAYYDSVDKVVFVVVSFLYPYATSSANITLTYLSKYLPGLATTQPINEAGTPASSVMSTPFSTLIDTSTGQQISGTNPVLTSYESYTTSATQNMQEGVVSGTLTPFTLGGQSFSGSTVPIILYAPFIFSNSPYQAGLYNPMQVNGNLGSLSNQAYDHPVIWGRALINTTLIDTYASGAVPFTFQLNYSVPGPLTINMAQMAWIASINNLPSSFTYLSYSFSNGYSSFLGIISSSSTLAMGTSSISPSGNFTINGNKFYVYLLVVGSTNSTSTAVEYVSKLVVEYPNSTTFLPQNVIVTTSKNNATLPVYEIGGPAGTTITLSGNWYSTPYNVQITVGSAPTLVNYVSQIQLRAVAYEGISASTTLAPYYSTAILSTPPSEINIFGSSEINAQGSLAANSASAKVSLLTNATLNYQNIPLQQYSFNGIIVTPGYPAINGTTAMAYLIGALYNKTTSNYVLSFAGSQEPMQAINNNLIQVTTLSPFYLTLGAPSVPATETGTSPLQLEFFTVPSTSYIALVDFGLWGNLTSVTVSAYDTVNNKVSVNLGYFYGVVIPPSISTAPYNYQNFICPNNYVTVTIYDPDAVLDPYPSGSFTTSSLLLKYGNMNVTGAIIFPGSSVYSPTGVFGYSNYVQGSPVTTFTYTAQSGPFSPVALTGNFTYLAQYADNNPTDNYYFIQTVNTRPVFNGGLSIVASPVTASLPSSTTSPGFMYLLPNASQVPSPLPGMATPNYNLNIYITYKVDGAVVGTNLLNGLYIASQNTLIYVVPNASFVGSSIKLTYTTTDYAVLHYFYSSKQYEVFTTVSVPNVAASLYFPSPTTPLYQISVPLYLSEPYYGSPLPTYIGIGTNGTALWNSPNYVLFGASAVQQYLGFIKTISITLGNGTTVVIPLTTNNIQTLFTQLIGQELQACNGTFQFGISISGLEKLLNLNVQQLNNSILNVTYHDFVTGETLTATTKLVALSTLSLVSKGSGVVQFLLTAYPYTGNITFAPPWFIAENVAKQPFLTYSDLQFAKTNPSNILSLSTVNITLVGLGGEASVYYNSISGQTVVTNIYGQTVATLSGNVLPTLTELAAGNGTFTGSLQFTIIPNNTVVQVPSSLTKTSFAVYTNGSLAIVLNGQAYSLGPAGLFLLPFVTYTGSAIGANATAIITVSDGVTTSTTQVPITAENFTPIRLAPFQVPAQVPLSNAPKLKYEYNSSIVITPQQQVVKIYVTSILPYPQEFQIQAFVYPASQFNVQTGSPTAAPVYFSYSAVRAYPALGIGTSVPNLLVYVQLQGISNLPAGKYVIVLSAVPFAGGPVLSEYPAQLIFTNVTLAE